VAAQAFCRANWVVFVETRQVGINEQDVPDNLFELLTLFFEWTWVYPFLWKFKAAMPADSYVKVGTATK
jgi:hypothetical protein